MKNKEYEIPEIQVISMEPNENLMEVGTSMGSEHEEGGIHG